MPTKIPSAYTLCLEVVETLEALDIHSIRVRDPQDEVPDFYVLEEESYDATLTNLKSAVALLQPAGVPIANFEHPMDLYGHNGNLALEDWLANFYVEVEQVHIETPPCTPTMPTTTVAMAVFQPTELGGLTITREMLVALFTEEAVVQVELDASLAYLGSLS